ncbi:MAG: hypothetical protein HYR88_08975 [Verrucomicrobia bacterium]|nr:hypothetical protein [Verrucomicrobiota bacterium]MBI3870655.1 hypothetical protein [Verrucomicrobiota bacterium]
MGGGPRAGGAALDKREPGVSADPKPLIASHAHNDYEHSRPLWDALDAGFCSVEADIHLVKGRLLVGHDAIGLSTDRTLEKLYLEPLRNRVRQFHGKVYSTPADFTLLIDIKTPADDTYKVLRRTLRHYRDILTRFDQGKVSPGAITVVLSGERPIAWVARESTRWCAIDGRLIDLDTNPPVSLVPWISASWVDTFRYRGVGPLPDAERDALFVILARCHAQGRRFRFWATGDDPRSWQLLRSAGVDILNADDLKGLQRFLLEK